MAETTATLIISAAFRKIGLSAPTATEQANALEALNNMISLWGAEFLTPYVVREYFALTIGTASYTIGSGGAFDTVRPMQIANAYLRDSDGYDYDLDVMSAKDYNLISLKTTDGRPTELYYVPAYPLAKIIFNYEPDEAYTAYFEFQKNFTELAALSTTVTLPDEYKEALVLNLAVALAEDNSVTLPQSVIVKAIYAKSLIERLIAANQITPLARFDFGNGGSYNIETDSY